MIKKEDMKKELGKSKERCAYLERINNNLVNKMRKQRTQATENHIKEDFLKREILKIKPDYRFDDSETFIRKRDTRARDKNLCCFCKRNILDISLDETLHHKVPKRYGGSDEPKNLITICEECHRLLEMLIKFVEERIWEQRMVKINKVEVKNEKKM